MAATAGSALRFVFLISSVIIVQVKGKRLSQDSTQNQLITEDSGTNSRKNVLLIIADDMRPEIKAYDRETHAPPSLYSHIKTPNLDRLASHSLLLQRAYVQQAVCGPSRTSMLTGRRPDTTHVYDIRSYFRALGGNFTTLPQYFKENGYITKGYGKVFHVSPASGGNDDDHSWSHKSFIPKRSKRRWISRKKSWMAVSRRRTEQRPLPDDLIVNEAIEQLQRLSVSMPRKGDNFFMSVGFHKPHLPFVFPEEFLNLYPYDNITLPTNMYSPVGMPEIAWSSWIELRNYGDIKAYNVSGKPNSTLPHQVTLDLRRAYFATVSYVDSLIGKLLTALETYGFWDNTVVAFWGDHGYFLGEHGKWCKHSNMELATQVPLMIRVPGRTDSGMVNPALVESVDIYPTLVEAAGLQQLPVCSVESRQERTCREGTSFMRLASQTDIHNWKKYAFSQYPRNNLRIMGYSMRSNRFRYTEWVRFNRNTMQPLWEKVKAVELYDHRRDPDENENVANKERYRGVVTRLKSALRRGWRNEVQQL